MSSIFDQHLDKTPANFVALSPISFVERREGANVTSEALTAHCKALLASYKVPRDIRFEAIPKTSTGKIQKFQLRERAKGHA